MIILKDNEHIFDNKNLCLVPTMGALHEGHIALINTAKKTEQEVIVSVFVNRLQFNDDLDFKNYPRDFEKDISILNRLNIEYGFFPDEEYMFPESGFNKLDAGNLGKKYEGNSRPGHFDGVITVVNRLFELIDPKTVVFGAKDFQQLFLIKKLILEKKYNIKLVENKTVRNISGLALSSRNQNLSNKGIQQASFIYKSLNVSKDEFIKNDNTIDAVKVGTDILFENNIDLDYFEILDYKTFSPPKNTTKKFIIIVAAYVEGIRLIDNIQFEVGATK
ncbi:pantoate--beta-alanine ligase [Acidimicrobiaceae bacterium]|nr:pantoate--beta-alanine ligase [Acidimicrobiaceae bacterium]